MPHSKYKVLYMYNNEVRHNHHTLSAHNCTHVSATNENRSLWKLCRWSEYEVFSIFTKKTHLLTLSESQHNTSGTSGTSTLNLHVHVPYRWMAVYCLHSSWPHALASVFINYAKYEVLFIHHNIIWLTLYLHYCWARLKQTFPSGFVSFSWLLTSPCMLLDSGPLFGTLPWTYVHLLYDT